MDRRLTAVMSLDVAGYSRLMEADEAGTLARLNENRTALIDPLTAEFSGRVVKLMGDGALLEFASVVQAVGFALELQRRMGARNEGLTSAERTDYRIGVNLGDVVFEGGDIFGDGVNVAARLEALADPGGICISGTAYDHVKSKLDCGFDFLGERQVKNIQEPVRIYRVHPDAENALKGASLGNAAAVRHKRASIALRRFNVHSGDAALADATSAFCEDLEIALAQLRSLQVLAGSLSHAQLEAQNTPAELRRITGVDYLLQGSVRPRGERLRLNVQVIHLQSGFNVWVERYDCSRADFEAGPEAVVESLVATTQTQILLHEGAIERHFDDERDRVEHLASKAWSLVYRLTPEALEQAEKLCAAAFTLDPNSARAHQALAGVRHHQFYMGFSAEPARMLREGLEHVDRAIEINDEDEYAHWIRGNLLMGMRDTQRSLAAFERSREINPSFSLAVASSGTTYAWAGQSAEAIARSEQALAANPKDPSNFFRINTVAVAHFATGDFEQALDWVDRTLERRQKFIVPHLIGAAAAAHLNAPDLADRTRRLMHEFPVIGKTWPDAAPFTRTENREALCQGLERAFATLP